MAAILHMTFSISFSLNENVWIPINISLKFAPKGAINNNPALVQMMALHQTDYQCIYMDHLAAMS